MTTVLLRTERLVLRRFTIADAELLVELDADPDVMRYITGGRATPREEIAAGVLPHWLAYYERPEGHGFWAAIDRREGEFLGWFHLRPGGGAPADEPELGYRLRKAAWGRGLATEGSHALVDRAFAALGARRVTASAMADNLASRRVMEKVGLRHVRSFRLELADHVEGDAVEYALTREDWQAARLADLTGP
jgi:RimJ/RimL family protein N-acetyltransferase